MAAQSSSRARLAVAKFLGTSSSTGIGVQNGRVEGPETRRGLEPSGHFVGGAQRHVAVPIPRESLRPIARGGVGLSEEQQARLAKERERSALEKVAASTGKRGKAYDDRRRNAADSSTDEDESENDAAESRTQSAKGAKKAVARPGDSGASDSVGKKAKKTQQQELNPEEREVDIIARIQEGSVVREDQQVNATMQIQKEREKVSQLPEIQGVNGTTEPRKKKKTRSRQKNLRRDTRAAHEKPAHLTDETLKQPRFALKNP